MIIKSAAASVGVISTERVRWPHIARPPCRSPGPVSVEFGSDAVTCHVNNAAPIMLAIQPRSFNECAHKAAPTKSAPAVAPHTDPDSAHAMEVPGKRRPAS